MTYAFGKQLAFDFSNVQHRLAKLFLLTFVSMVGNAYSSASLKVSLFTSGEP